MPDEKPSAEKPFRPSTEFDNEWLTERPANLQPIHIPDIYGPSSDWSKAMHALIAAQLADVTHQTGIYIPAALGLIPTEPTTPELKDLNLDDK